MTDTTTNNLTTAEQADEVEYDERPFALEMAEKHLEEALRFLRMGRPTVAKHYARLAQYRLGVALRET